MIALIAGLILTILGFVLLLMANLQLSFGTPEYMGDYDLKSLTLMVLAHRNNWARRWIPEFE